MSKIVIFCDGTGNDTSDDNALTNVAHIRNILMHQGVKAGKSTLYYRPNSNDGIAYNMSHGNKPDTFVYYDRGVGTDQSGWLSLRKLFNQATGGGLFINVVQAYEFLSRVYTPGDEIYLFGFSRGAYTVRSLAGMIGRVGLVRNDLFSVDLIDRAAHLYQHADERGHELDEFRAATWPSVSDDIDSAYPYPLLNIHFMGVFDTVKALGAPRSLPLLGFLSPDFDFHDHRISELVINAYHAVSIDERRSDFIVTLWDVNKNHTRANGFRRQTSLFPGVHSDVGGSYHPSQAGLANNALIWMLSKARKHGLGIKITERVKSVYKSTSTNTALHDSFKSFYKLFRQERRDALLGSKKDQRLHQSFFDLYGQDILVQPNNGSKNLMHFARKKYNPKALSEDVIDTLKEQNNNTYATESDSGSVTTDSCSLFSFSGSYSDSSAASSAYSSTCSDSDDGSSSSYSYSSS